jgi:hypothetical protein
LGCMSQNITAIDMNKVTKNLVNEH